MEGEETWLDHYNSEFAVPGVTWRITTPMDKWATRYSHLRPIPTYGAFPLTARSHLRPIPTYGPFPLTVHGKLPVDDELADAVRLAAQCRLA